MDEYGEKSSKFQILRTIYDTANVPSLFVELDILRLGPIEFNDNFVFNPMDPGSYHWIEKARWIKFEENYNEASQRFNPAHVSPLNFKTLVEFRTNLDQHLKIIESDHTRMDRAMLQMADVIYQNEALLTEPERDILYGILLAPRLRSENKHVYGRINHAFELNEGIEKPSRYMNNSPQIKLKKQFSISRKVSQNPYGSNDYFNYEITKTLSDDCESCIVMSGVLDILTRPVMKLLRVKNPFYESLLVEVKKPVRFIFICMGPSDRGVDYCEFARCFAVMMKNRRFRAAAYEANSGEQLMIASNTFLETSVVLPIIRNVTAYSLGGMAEQIRKFEKNISKGEQHGLAKIEEVIKTDPIVSTHKMIEMVHEKRKVNYKEKFIHDFWPPCIQLVRAVKPFVERYASDFTDAFTPNNAPLVFSSIFFLYFVCLGPAITFGAILNSPTMPVTTIIFGSGVYLLLFGLFSGQPLAVIGLTAPTYIIETSIMNSAAKLNIDVSTLRFWVAIYGSMFGILFLIFNLSALTRHIRESLEEVFNAFIDCFYALKALFTMFKAIKAFRPSYVSLNLDQFNETVPKDEYVIMKKNAVAGTNLFLAFVMLLFCLILANFKNGNFFRRKIRKMLGAFNVPLGILLVVGLERIFFQAYDLPKLPIPPSDKVDPKQWVHLIDVTKLSDYGNSTSMEVHSLAVPIGLALAVLVFTESSLNGITALKNKAKKTGIFEADFILLIVIFPLVSGFIGWPFVSGATVRTISHVTALTVMEERPAPGMSAKMLGTVEQRVSLTIVAVFLTCSVFIGTILQFIPIAALYGMFLYMGIMGLKGLILVNRCVALFKRRKHWRDWDYIKGLPSKHILVFSVIEASFVGILIILNIISEFTKAKFASLIFPLVIFVYGILREFIYPQWPWMRGHLHHLDEKHKTSVHPEGGEAQHQEDFTEKYYKKNSSIDNVGTLHALPADPITDFGRINMANNEDTWKVRRTTVNERKISMMNAFEGYRNFLASYSGKELNEYSDEEVDGYVETWAT